MILYRTTQGIAVEHEGRWYAAPAPDWDELVNREDLAVLLARAIATGLSSSAAEPVDVVAPIGRQEVWGAGVTYLRSRTARIEESRAADGASGGGGGGDFYDRVYRAPRPELFFKATPHRVVGPGGVLHLRADSRWIVPEPELTLLVTRTGKIAGYTIGNDLSCRDLEGQNPLYLPQAKTFTRCAALGPGILVTSEPLPPSTGIALEIRRAGAVAFAGTATLAQMQRPLPLLVEYLFRDNVFPDGALLMTGTGIVPPDALSLQKGDEVRITIAPIGTLVNTVD